MFKERERDGLTDVDREIKLHLKWGCGGGGVRVCLCACVRTCVRVCVCECVRSGVRAGLRACVRALCCVPLYYPRVI